MLTALLLMAAAHGQGIPFVRNFLADDYQANNINFDIETDQYGNVYVANFEGLMVYDHAEWRIIHTPDITRATVVYRASDNTIWVGGYNYFGKMERKDNGYITLRRIADPRLFRDEVLEIYEQDGELLFVTPGSIYRVNGDRVSLKRKVDEEILRTGVLDVLNINALEKGEKNVVRNDTTQVVPLHGGMKAVVTKNRGIIITDADAHPLYTINDTNGLCSNDVSYATYDGHGHLWGATGRGVFVIQVPAAISRLNDSEGLQGAILSINSLHTTIYAGTTEGLYRQEGYRFVSVPAIRYACWELKTSGDGLLAATADGIYRIHPSGNTSRLTYSNTMTLLDEGTHIYSGETDGIYIIGADGKNRKKVCDLNNVRKLVKDKKGNIWAQTLYGAIWQKKATDSQFKLYPGGEKTMRTIVPADGGVLIVGAEDSVPIPYPLLSYADDRGVTWLTDNQGRNLYQWKGGKRLTDIKQLLATVSNIPIRSIHTRQGEIWLGHDNGIMVINTQAKDPALATTPKLLIRSVRLGGDSILWGGFGEMPATLPQLDHHENNLHFTFSLDYPFLAGQTLYRHRLNDGKWSTWSTSTSAHFANLSYGSYTFTVQALDAYNRMTNDATIKFSIKPPFYVRWYMNLLYLLILMALFYALFRLRLQRLEREKLRLERIVKERTAEVVRLEKVATAGKLTRGLIDRILNPLNYINNFAKLSEGLVRDIKANVEDEKEHMAEENYEDTMEVVDMLTVNLQKVGEHGQNTARTLKAMEELLEDRTGGILPIDLADVLTHDQEMLCEYYKQDIGQYHIKTVFEKPQRPLPVNGNADQLSKTILSLLSNAIYAVIKKAQKASEGHEDYTPEIALRAALLDDAVQVSIHDNGTGIEEAILDKIFDPFFTTKTTGEAAGVGLYLSHEIVQNHGGDIQVRSVKNEYSEFIITLPLRKA